MPLDQDFINKLQNDAYGTTVLLGKVDYTPEEIETLADALSHAKSVTEFDIEGDCLTDDTIKPLISALKTLPRISDVAFAGGQLTDAGGEAVAELIKERLTIKTLSVSGNVNMKSDGICAILEAAEKGGLGDFAAFNCGITPEMLPELVHTIRYYQPRNLTDFDLRMEPSDCGEYTPYLMEIGEFCTANSEIAQHLGNKLANSEMEEWEIADLSSVGGRFEPVRSYISPLSFTKLNDKLETLPTLPEDAPVTLEALTAPDERGFTPLDNPKTWAKFDALAAELAEAGTPITKAFLLETRNRDGESVLCNGIRNGQMPAMQQALAGVEETIDAMDLNADDGAALRAIMNGGHTAQIMNETFWEEQPRAMKEIWGAIPEEQRQLVPNRHSLLATADRMIRAERAMNLG